MATANAGKIHAMPIADAAVNVPISRRTGKDQRMNFIPR